MTFEHLQTYGWEAAFRGMRNPLDSWDKSDSLFTLTTMEDADDKIIEWLYDSTESFDSLNPKSQDGVIDFFATNGLVRSDVDHKVVELALLGTEDISLAKRLIKGGAEHRKFLRQLGVSFDLTAPRFIWSEFDTYHFNTKNSCSTMHTLMRKPVTIANFEVRNEWSEDFLLNSTIPELNKIIGEYRRTKDSNLLLTAKEILPESFLQKRTVTTNYEEIGSMLHQRESHRLPHWSVDFVDFVGSFPYADFLLGC